MASKAIGIDLGTTNSSVAVYKYGRVEVIANIYGNRMTPSCVAFTENGIYVGEPANFQQTIDPVNTVVAVKRIMGRRFSEPCVQEDLKNWSFKVVAGPEDVPQIEVQNMGKTERYSPEDISSMVLRHMKDLAENNLGHAVTDAVITIPASFGDAQRQATYKAAQLAGLNVLRLISEAAAGALAYGFDSVAVGEKDRHILVYDFGGGTLDVSILRIGKTDLFEVKGLAGNSHLGGDDFDNRAVEHFVAVHNRSFNIWGNLNFRCSLKWLCERAKRALTWATVSAVNTEWVQPGWKGNALSREQLEMLCVDLFEKALMPVEQALKDAKLSKNAIDEIVLTGGASRMPKIQGMIQTYFNGKQLCKTIAPDEAVAYGAAIVAAKMSGIKTGRVDRIKFLDITSLSLSIENVNGDSIVMIPRGSAVPAKFSRIWQTCLDDQEAACTKIYEGEHIKAKDNCFLGSFLIEGLPLKPKGEVKFDKTMEIDESGLLHVTSVEKSIGLKNAISFTHRVG